MSNNKQSSVEWLIEQLQAPCRGIPSHIIEQAKAMHKEENVNTFKHAQVLMVMDSSKRAEQYYEETFGETKPEE